MNRPPTSTFARVSRTLVAILVAVTSIISAAGAALAAGAHQAAQPATPSEDLSLRALGMGEIVARGIRPRVELFFPGPGDREILANGTMLHLTFDRSDLLVPQKSAISVRWNDRPIYDEAYGPANLQRVSRDIPVPGALIEPDTNRVTILIGQHVPDDLCPDNDHPALHTTIGQDTSIRYALGAGLRPNAPGPELSKYPGLLLRQTGAAPTPISIVVPDAATAQELEAAASVAAQIGRAAVQNRIDVRLVTDSERSAAASAGHLVAIGSPERNTIVRHMLEGGQIGARAASDGLTDMEGRLIAADDGVVGLSRSPWAPGKYIATATGWTPAAVQKSASVLSSTIAPRLLLGSYATVQDVRALTASVVDEREAIVQENGFVTEPFRAWGKGDEAFRGVTQGGASTTLWFDASPLPGGTHGYLDLVYSASPIMDRNRSSITVTLNETPISGVSFRDSDGGRQTARIELPFGALRPGVNQLTLQASLYTRAAQDWCSQTGDEQAWMTIDSDSSLTLPPTNLKGPFGLNTWPYPFLMGGRTDNALIVVPDDLGQATYATEIAAEIGRFVRAEPARLQIIRQSELSEAQRAANHLIVYSPPGPNPLLSRLDPSLFVRFKDQGREVFDGPDQLMSARDRGVVGVIQVIRSPFNPERAVSVFSATDTSAMPWTIAAVRRGKLAGNVLVAQAPSAGDPADAPRTTTFSLGSEEAKKQAEITRAGKGALGGQIPMLAAGAAALGVVVLLVVMALTNVRARRARRLAISMQATGGIAPGLTPGR
ncbi:MAG: cellulose biosynthesis cyclic di-GMP-binding regulatory protein BcsB [Chloroflexota bacterium]